VEGGYIKKLPVDSHLPDNDGDSGYMYIANNEGTVYKFMAKKIVEAEVIDYNHPLKSCDITASGSDCDKAMCNCSQGGSSPNHCRVGDDQFETSYGAWGGFADPADPTDVLSETQKIICNQK
jgi:hypothetical protein